VAGRALRPRGDGDHQIALADDDVRLKRAVGGVVGRFTHHPRASRLEDRTVDLRQAGEGGVGARHVIGRSVAGERDSARWRVSRPSSAPRPHFGASSDDQRNHRRRRQRRRRERRRRLRARCGPAAPPPRRRCVRPRRVHGVAGKWRSVPGVTGTHDARRGLAAVARSSEASQGASFAPL